MSHKPDTKRRRAGWASLSRKEKDGIRRKLFREQMGICPVCDQPMDEDAFSIDHKVSCARGGTSSIQNLQAMHVDCNTLKGSGTIGQARRRYALLRGSQP